MPSSLSKMPSTTRSDPRATDWCFTWNNPPATLQDAVTWRSMLDPHMDKIQYIIAQLEIGEENGTIHWQGYVEFKKRTKLSTLKNILPQAHWEKRRGTREEARAYCRKEETRLRNEMVELGRWIELANSRPSKSDSKFAELFNLVKLGAKDDELIDKFPALYARYFKAIDRARFVFEKKRNWPMNVIVLIGPTGTGKTSYAIQSSEDYFIKTIGSWWDGYHGQETVILDEFYGWLPYAELLKLLDRYPHMVPVKGGFREFTSKTIYIISNSPISKWYSGERIQPYLPALYRRISSYKLCLTLENHVDCTDRGTYELLMTNYDW